MQTKRTSGEETLNEVNDVMAQVDDLRMESLENARELQQLKHDELVLEAKRLENKYGPSHAMTNKAILTIAYSERLQAAFDLQIELTKKKTDEFNPTSWRVQGFVTDANYTPVANAIVSLSTPQQDSRNNRFFNSTDNLGLYSITIAGENLAEFKDTRVFLNVVTNNQNYFPESETPVEPVAGVIDIVNITLNYSNETQTDPLK